MACSSTKTSFMASKTLTQMWTDVFNYGKKVRTDIIKNDLDPCTGRDKFQLVKKQYTHRTQITIKEEFIDFMIPLLYNPDDNKDPTFFAIKIGKHVFDNSTDRKHFLYQHFMIPKSCLNKKQTQSVMPIIKLLQIAYNSGQFIASSEHNQYPNEIVTFYNNKKMGNIETYIDSSLCDSIPQ